MATARDRQPEPDRRRSPPRRRLPAQLSAHVPIRFRPEVIAKVRVLAGREHKTVSAWIRDLVEAEADRRLPSQPLTKGPEVRVSLDRQPPSTTRAAWSGP